MIQLFVYVPESHLERVKLAMFSAGAGRSERYEQCAWQTIGDGQFMPLESSKPYTGNPNEVTYVKEYKLEMICNETNLAAVIGAMKQAHPYEEPAYGALTFMRV